MAVVSRPSPVPSSFKSRAAPSSSAAPPVPSLRPPASPRSRRDDAYGHHPRPTSPSALSLRLLSEKILDGHVMSRSRCGTCGSALLLPPGIRLPRERGACAVCPALAARGGISRAAVSRRVAAARLLHDDGDVPTADEVLDAACVEAAREEGRGSKWVRRADGPCGGCGSPNAMATRDGGEACPACNVMDRELGPACHREVRQDAAPTEAAEVMPSDAPAAVQVASSYALETLWNDDDDRKDGANSLALDDVLRSEFGGTGNGGGSLATASVRSSSVATGDHGGVGCGPGGLLRVPDLSRIDLALLRDRINGELARLHGGCALHGAPALPSLLAAGDCRLPSQAQQDQVPAAETPAGHDYARLQDQLRSELERARESQAALERSIAGEPPLASLAGPPVVDMSHMTRDELRAELARVMGGMEALEKVLNNTTDDKDDGGADDDRNGLSPRLLDEIQEDIRDDHHHLHRPDSISAQEVDKTGNLKEYIPPPAFYQTSNIPEYIEVEIMPDLDGAEAWSVAQSYHTRHLKRSEYQTGRHGHHYDSPGGGVGGGRARLCCGCLPASSDRARRELADQPQWNDDDTIETDDYTVDYTLNTIPGYREDGDGDDASRYGGGHYASSKSRDLDASEHRWRSEQGNGDEGLTSFDDDDTPFLLRFFSCGRSGGGGGGGDRDRGGDDRGDEYTMVSQRGLNSSRRSMDFRDGRLREVSDQFLRVSGAEDEAASGSAPAVARNQSSVDLSEEYRRRQGSYEMKRELEKRGETLPPPRARDGGAGDASDAGSVPDFGRPPSAPRRRPSVGRDTDSHMSPPTIAQSPSISSKRRGLPPLAPVPPPPPPPSGADGDRSPDYLSDDDDESDGISGVPEHYPAYQPRQVGSPRTALRDGLVKRVSGGSITSDITDWDALSHSGVSSPLSPSSYPPRRLGALAEEAAGQDLPILGKYEAGFEEEGPGLRSLEGPTFKY